MISSPYIGVLCLIDMVVRPSKNPGSATDED